MRKDTKNAKITEMEIKRNKQISKKIYIVEQYFGLSTSTQEHKELGSQQ